MARQRNVFAGPDAGLANRIYDAESRARQTPEGVRVIQEMLRRNGYGIDVDGKWGPQTELAYASYNATRQGASRSSGRSSGAWWDVAPDSDDFLVREYLNSRKMTADAAARRAHTIRGYAPPRVAPPKKKSRWERIGGAILDAVDEPIERLVRRPLNAQRYWLLNDPDNGILGDVLGSGRAFLSAMPGLGTLADDDLTREAVRSTDTREERQALHEAGRLPTFGELVTGRANETLTDQRLRALNPQIASGGGPVGRLLPDRWSGGFDLGLELVADPLNAAGGIFNDLARVGRLRTPVQRGRYLGTRNGRALLDAATSAAVGAPNVKALRRSIPNLPTVVAERLEQAARTGGRTAIRDELSTAFQLGLWDPVVHLRNQALVGLGVRSRPGRSAVRRGGLHSLVDQWGRGSTPQAIVVNSRNVDQVLGSSLKASLARAGVTFRDFYDSAVAPAVAGARPRARVARLVTLVDTLDNAALQDVVREVRGDIVRNPANPEALRRLEQAETLAALIQSGGLEAEQAMAGLGQGLAVTQRDALHIANRTRRNAGLGRARRSTASADLAVDRTVVETIANSRMSGALREKFLQAAARAFDANDARRMGRLVRDAEDLAANPNLMNEATRLADNEVRRIAEAAVRPGRSGLLRRAAAAPILGTLESVAPTRLAFQAGPNADINAAKRVEDFDRWLMGFGVDPFTRNQLLSTVENVATEEDLYGAVRNGLTVIARMNGVDEGALHNILEANLANIRAQRAFALGVDGRPITDVQVLAHRVEEIPLPDRNDVMRTVNDLRAASGNRGAQVKRAGLSAGRALSDSTMTQALLGASVGAGIADPEDRLKGAVIGGLAGAVGLQRIHTLWKFSVVTNLPSIAAGAVAGASAGGFQGALIGAGIGVLGPVRYLARVGLIEEKLRTYMRQGFTASEFVPGLSRWMRNRGVPLPFRPHDAVRAGDMLGPHLSNRVLVSIAPEWGAVAAGDPRFVDAWWRIVNYQLHVETDFVAEVFVRQRAGLMSPTDARIAASDFLQNTAEGQLVLRRLRSGTGGPRNINEALDRYENFVAEHMTPRIAAERLNGEVARDVLKAERRAGSSPAAVHAQRTWVIPRNARDLFSTGRQLTSKLILGGPTSRFNRIPMAEHIYAKEARRLLANGVSPQEAQRIAEEIAVERTNAIMFQIEDESRSARKLDFVFPFQQPREEILRVWARLVVQNPWKAAKVARLGALAFNNGRENGMFRKDPFGEWVMTVPGSAYLSDRLFGAPFGFEAGLRDFLFVGQGAYGLGFVPSPGGPYWSVASRYFIERHPDVWQRLEQTPWLKQLLFPYAVSGKLLRNEPNRLWMAFTGATPPWEFASTELQKNELLKWQKQIALHMRAEYLRAHPEVEDWWPSPDEVNAATSDFLRSWAFFGSVFPAAPRPITPNRDEANAIKRAYQAKYGDEWYRHAVEQNPVLAPYFSSEYDYVGPDDLKNWLERDEAYADKFVNAYYEQRSWQELKKRMEEARKQTAAFNEFRRHLAEPDRLRREALLIEWRKQYPEYAEDMRNNYYRVRDLATILNTYPAHQRSEAIDRWRQQYDVAPGRPYQRILKEAREFEVDPWREARDPEDVAAGVRSQLRLGMSEAVAVAQLQPVEQYHYWQTKLMEFTYDRMVDDPKAVMRKYQMYRDRITTLFRENPEMLRGRNSEVTPMEAAVAQWQGDYYKALDGIYAEVGRVGEAMRAAADAKQWDTYYALKAKRTALHDQARAIRNKQYEGFPGLVENQDEVRAMFAFAPPGMTPAQFAELNNRLFEQTGFAFVTGGEEKVHLARPDAVKQAYVDDLLNRLQTPAGEKGKLFYEWLTDFQKDLLERNLPADMLEDFKADTVAAADAAREAGGGGGRGGVTGELGYAYAMFDEYNQRPQGAVAPAGYEQYLALPDNPVLKADFLRSHPDVAEWIRLGPMANMPEVVRYIVANIMIKHGKWEGELRTIEEITDLAFAREQMRRWSRRPEGVTAPSTYDLWLNMPTGVEKALYFRAHPEIADWLRLGPMANMPDDYREVVRDIMLRYGEWTERNDPLGQTIAAYYATPGYAKDQYLRDHPELLEYWSALRTPEENRMFGLADQYFSINESNAKKAFLASHPELQQWFVEQRSKRYERFLNRVAQFMGANPELFMQYLERQEDILAELLHRFAEPNLVREVIRLGESGEKGKSESGRARRTAR